MKDPNNELSFDPKDLLTQIASIYVNLARRDSQDVFAQAITADKRSYYEDMFAEATQVLIIFFPKPRINKWNFPQAHSSTTKALDSRLHVLSLCISGASH